MKYLRLLVLIGVPVLAGLFSVVMGKDSNWDFLNYRWYAPYALLHGRLLTDVLVSEHATFYNPLLELPFFLIATHLPSIVAGFLVALAASIAFVPLCLLAEQSLSIENERHRFMAAAGIALSGLLGGGVLGQVGVVSWDLPLGTPTFLALYVLAKDGGKAITQPREVTRLLLAGLLAGSAAGLKLTAAVYPLGMALGLLIASRGNARSRVERTVLFGLGGAIGMALLGGYWMWRLQDAFGNPVFPYFNNLFKSPYAEVGGNRDATFLPHDALTALTFPFLFSANSRRVAEYHFRDVHIAGAYLFIVVALASLALRKVRAEGLVVRPVAWFLFAVAAISFAAWEYMFAIYRYILPLEMLSPLLMVLAIGCLPLPRKAVAAASTGMLVISLCLISVGWNRRPWAGDYVSVMLPHAIADNATVIMTGGAPMGFVVPSLPQGVTVLRAGSYLAIGDAFAGILHNRIAATKGPMLVLFAPGDEAATEKTLFDYRLASDFTRCEWVRSNVSEDLRLCPVERP